MRRLRLLAFVALFAVVCCVGGGLAAQQSKLNVLLITGDDVGAHNWQKICEGTRAALAASPRFNVKVCEEPLILESATALKRCDVVMILSYNAQTPTITDEAKENLLNAVKSGKGFYVQHLASASFKEWKDYGKLCGRNWVMGTSGHGPRSPFKANVVNKEHPITKGMQDFEADDELYAKLQGDGPIDVLISAYSDWSKKTEPLVFTTMYGKGRCAHNAFGHDTKALADPNVKKIIRRAVEWAATGKVTVD